MKFKTKTDISILVYYSVIGIYVAYLIYLFVSLELYLVSLFPLVILLMIIDSLLRTNYEFKENFLVLRSSIFSVKIKYEDIESYQTTKRLWGAFSLSRNQLIIHKKRGPLLFRNFYVSPKEQELFVLQLKSRCYSIIEVR